MIERLDEYNIRRIYMYVLKYKYSIKIVDDKMYITNPKNGDVYESYYWGRLLCWKLIKSSPIPMKDYVR